MESFSGIFAALLDACRRADAASMTALIRRCAPARGVLAGNAVHRTWGWRV